MKLHTPHVKYATQRRWFQRCSPIVHRGGVTQDTLERRERLNTGVLTGRNAPICQSRSVQRPARNFTIRRTVGIEGTARTGRPDDRAETHRVRDGTDTVVYVAPVNTSLSALSNTQTYRYHQTADAWWWA